jgi:hypothetical protein
MAENLFILLEGAALCCVAAILVVGVVYVICPGLRQDIIDDFKRG